MYGNEKQKVKGSLTKQPFGSSRVGRPFPCQDERSNRQRAQKLFGANEMGHEQMSALCRLCRHFNAKLRQGLGREINTWEKNK